MKYKELHSITYDDPNWDEADKKISNEWLIKIKNEDWHYPDKYNTGLDKKFNASMPPIKKLNNNNEKFKFLMSWEIDNKEIRNNESPLNSLCLSAYYRDEYGNKDVRALADKMFDEYYSHCEDSFVDLNMPEIFGIKESDNDENGDVVYNPNNNEYDNHVEELQRVFKRSDCFKKKTEDGFEEILKKSFMFKHLCLMVKYHLPNDNDLTKAIKKKFDKLITSGEPKKQNIKNELIEEIKTEAKKNFRASFIFLNINPEIKGTAFEDDSIIRLGKLFDEDYDYLAEEFCADILKMFNK